MSGSPHPEAKKSLGQNFLVSAGTVDAIVDAIRIGDEPGGPVESGRAGRCAVPEGSGNSEQRLGSGNSEQQVKPGCMPVLEIGPGTGALTIPLAEKGTRLAAFEIDDELAETLTGECEKYDEVEIVKADVRELDFDEESARRGWDQYVIAGNIPYLLTSTILIKVGMARRCERAVIMMQKEVGDRVAAAPGTRGCGILSVFMQAWFDIKKVTIVKASAFRPRPKIDSVVLAFDRVARTGAPEARREFFEFVKTGFSQRRKKLINVLCDLPKGRTCTTGTNGPLGKIAARRLAGIAGVDTDRRPEQLGLEEWFALFEAFAGRPGS